MQVSSEIVLFLGAGVSAPEPACVPMFPEIRDACAERVGVRTAAWADDDPRRVLLNNVVPEVFLKLLTDAGYRLEAALAGIAAPSSNRAPTAVHRLAARVIAAGGMVWTTNWDEWVEFAYRELYGTSLAAAVHGRDPWPMLDSGLGKLHGSCGDLSSMMFRTPQVIRPLDEDWRRAIVDSCRNKVLCIVGYAGADVDLYPALRDATVAANATYWFEGVCGTSLSNDERAQYERWRFGFDEVYTDPSVLPERGRYLVWCGDGSTTTDPSRGLLDAFGDPAPIGQPPPPASRYEIASRQITDVAASGPLGRRVFVQAVIRERLADRRGAARRYLCVVLAGPARERVRALGALRNLVLLRSHRLRLALSRLYGTVVRGDGELFRRHAGDISHDPGYAARVADGAEEVTIDQALTVAMSSRWAGDLRISERIARAQLERALTHDLDNPERDWPERVSRAAYELAEALLWQGRFYEADGVCRTGYMRVSGAKWTAWESVIRGAVRFAHGEYGKAESYFAEGEEILRLEGFTDFGTTLANARSATLRVQGQLDAAERHLRRAEQAPRQGPGSVAAVLAEAAELALARGDVEAALQRWNRLCLSPLPLWKGIAHLRLAEVGADRDRNLKYALSSFTTAGSHWGMLRTQAASGEATIADIERKVAELGPVAVFVPGGPWLM